jgi:hypothetical protein
MSGAIEGRMADLRQPMADLRHSGGSGAASFTGTDRRRV